MGAEESLRISPESERPLVDHPDRSKPRPTESKTGSDHPDLRSGSKREVAVEQNSWQRSAEATAIIESLQGHNQELSIVMDPRTHQVVVKVMDSTTGEMIRKLPLNASMPAADNLTGLLLDAAE